MNCCNSFGECEHGPGCPAGAATMPPTDPVHIPACPMNGVALNPAAVASAMRTCESLGVCQHPERECAGACEKKPRVPSWEPTDPTQPVQSFTVETFGRDNFVTCLLVVALSGAMLGIAYGAGRWMWQVYQAWAVLA